MGNRFIRHFGVGFLLVLICDFLVGSALRRFYFTERSGLHYRTTYSIDSTNAEILVFGSSKANHNYVPDLFEKAFHASFYNAGRDGAGIFYHLAVLKSNLRRHKPKIIIFDYTGKFDRNRESYDRLSSLLPYYQGHKEIRSIIEMRSPFEKIKLLSRIYPFNSMLFTIIIGNMKLNSSRKPDDKGYVALHREWPDKIDSMKTSRIYDIDDRKVAALKDTDLFRLFASFLYLQRRLHN
jgi:hypothetical protein